VCEDDDDESTPGLTDRDGGTNDASTAMDTEESQNGTAQYFNGYLEKDCQAWTGPKYNALLRHSLADHHNTVDMDNGMNSHY